MILTTLLLTWKYYPNPPSASSGTPLWVSRNLKEEVYYRVVLREIEKFPSFELQRKQADSKLKRSHPVRTYTLRQELLFEDADVSTSHAPTRYYWRGRMHERGSPRSQRHKFRLSRQGPVMGLWSRSSSSIPRTKHSSLTRHLCLLRSSFWAIRVNPRTL